MANYQTTDLRNVVLAGHGSSGKTTLMEGMLYKAGVTNRLGRVEDKNTISDYEPEEKERTHSINSSVCHINYKGKEINFIDVPGYQDFYGSAIGPFRAADLAVITIDASKGIEFGTRRFWDLAIQNDLPTVFVLTKSDHEHAKFDEVVSAIKDLFGNECQPYAAPDSSGGGLTKIVSVLDPAAADEMEEYKGEFLESAVEADDELLEKYLEGEELTLDILGDLVPKALTAKTVIPVIPVSAIKDIGLDVLLDFLASYGPSPVRRERTAIKDEEEITLEQSSDGPASAFVFKTIVDPFVGKINIFRVFSGVIKSNSTVWLSATDKTEKISQLTKLNGKEMTNVDELICGDIGAVSKVDNLGIGDSFGSDAEKLRFPELRFPNPMISLAIEPKTRGDEQKMTTALKRLSDEDVTFQAERNRQTKELVMSGLGTLHLDVMLQKMKRKYDVEVTTKPPKIPYLETITSGSEARYRHKKQSGGAGQFAEVAIRIEPNERGEGFEFLDEIVGGVIPNQFIPSCEKGIVNIMEEGILGRYPIVDVKVHLWDGKHHPVDSKDIAFQIAARDAFKDAFMRASPTFLEPLAIIEVSVPSKYMGDIISDLNSRRGRISGSEQVGDISIIKAIVPYADVSSYTNDLRSITGGEGTFTLEFSHYDTVPAHVREQLIDKAKKSD